MADTQFTGKQIRDRSLEGSDLKDSFIIQPATDVVALKVKPKASGVANSLELYNNAGVMKVSVDKDGNIISIPGIIDGLGGTLNFIVDGGGSALSTGAKGWIRIPFKMQILGWVITGQPSGSVVVDILKCSYAEFPTFASIVGTVAPTISSASKNQGDSMVGWVTVLNIGDFVRLSVSSVSTITYLTLNMITKRII
ncbi:hypothetical protein KKF17_03560 [Patescibacteria group bacterium]|nr:hypothetical protein [Patescibacteria group bacterium]